MDQSTLFGLCIIAFIFYFLPSFVGHGRKHAAGIFLTNLLLGWTFFGWCIALIWAVSSPKNNSYASRF